MIITRAAGSTELFEVIYPPRQRECRNAAGSVIFLSAMSNC